MARKNAYTGPKVQPKDDDDDWFGYDEAEGTEDCMGSCEGCDDDYAASLIDCEE